MVRSLVADVRRPTSPTSSSCSSPSSASRLIQALGADFDFEVLTEVDEKVRDQLSEALPNDVLAKAVTELDSDDAAYLLEKPRGGRPEGNPRPDAAGRACRPAAQPANTRKRPPAASCRRTSSPCRRSGRSARSSTSCATPRICPRRSRRSSSSTRAIHLLGSVDISRLLRSKRDVNVDTIMDTDRHIVLATADQEAVARQFERYGLMSAPVVDKNERLVGVVTVDDVVEVIEQEVEEDAKLLAGVGDERLSDSVREIAPPRFSWLFVNLFTAILAPSVISLFDATIEKHGGARRADADRRLHGRQRRHADHDGRRACAGHRELNPANIVPRRAARNYRRLDQRVRFRIDHGAGRLRVVRHRAARVRHRRGDDRQHARGGAGGNIHSAGARSHGLRSRSCLNGVRDDGDRCGRILLVPWASKLVAHVRKT